MLTYCRYKQIVRDRFRDQERGQPTRVAEELDEGFNVLRLLGEQMYLHQCSSSTTTDVSGLGSLSLNCFALK